MKETSIVLNKSFFIENNASAEVDAWSYRRETVKRFNLKPGAYKIIPSTFEPNQEGEFLLRVFSEKPLNPVDNVVPVEPEYPVIPVIPVRPDSLCPQCKIL